MRLASPRSAILACALAAAVLAAGCKSAGEEGTREGLGVHVGGLKYTVFITRQINQHLASDRGYYQGPEPKPGFTYYGVFIQVCNETPGFKTPVKDFTVRDSQGNEFHPLDIGGANVFAYHPRRLSKNACVPEAGTPAATGPTGGALLVFNFPVQTIENRPLKLDIRTVTPEGKVESEKILLDL
jgi:hypothetical protein